MNLLTDTSLISIGLTNILAGKPRYTPTKAYTVQKETKRLLSSFLSKDTPDTLSKLPSFDWKETKELFDSLDPTTNVDALLAAMEGTELSAEVLALSTAIYDDLKVRFPVVVRETITGDLILQPADNDVARYARRWAVATDPMVVVRDLTQHSLSTEQVEALNQYYPQYAQYIRDTVVQLLLEIKGRRPLWQLDMPRENLLRRLFNQPRPTLTPTPPAEQAPQQQSAPTPKAGKPLKLPSVSTPGERNE